RHGLGLIGELIGDAEPDVQKALAWALRSMAAVDLAATTAFLDAEASQAAETNDGHRDRKSTRLNSSHVSISYAVFCLKKKTPCPGPLQSRDKEHGDEQQRDGQPHVRELAREPLGNADDADCADGHAKVERDHAQALHE